ncbi:hypothetical protein [Burkholderia sp. JKS000303]|uniref:hypothetical protein n=1 Tax=Burkholderia sp. JKS000303 TaxID=1938747 RepID=UPI001180130F|nr:hypothetical protein [Burkholderia sp. JKS000303]
MTVLIAFSGVAATTSAYAQQQQQQQPASQAAAPAYTAQLAARSNDGSSVRATAATKAIVPLRPAPATRQPATDADCVGPVSFCNVYFGS